MPVYPLTIASLRGGLNESAPISLGDDQCTVAHNIEWVRSPLGERRRGAVSVDLTGLSLPGGPFYIMWVHRHLPTQNLADAQLWVLVNTSVAGNVLAYKDTSWHTVAMADALGAPPGTAYEWHVNGQTLHGKLFLAYPSAVDRLHVWDGTTLRRTGLATAGLPPGVATFGTGTFADVRYYRTRFTRQVSGQTIMRSEPSPSVAFTPPGTGQGATITRQAPPGEAETHWEVEASADNTLFYRIATVALGTTTYDDVFGIANYPQWPLSEDIGDYTLQPSFRYLAVDGDRLLGASSFFDVNVMSRLYWTPVQAGTGVGNDERLALDTNPYLDLDNYEGGDITNLSNNVNGYNYVTKWSHTYQIARTGVRTAAYEAIPLTKQRGAAHGTLVEAFNQAGKPFLFALDPDVGPVHIGGVNGIAPCGLDLLETWQRVNLDAMIVGRGVYYAEKQQVHWWVAVDGGIAPTVHLVLHVNLMRPEHEGSRGGFAIWDAGSAFAYTVCMFADNVNANTARSRNLKPVIGRYGASAADLLWQLDTGDNDVGTPYYASVKTKPFARSGLLDHFEAGEAQLMVRNANGALVDVVVTGMRSDKSLVTKTVSAINLTQGAGEGVRIIRSLDNLSLAELQTVQIEVKDTGTAAPGPQWQLELVSVTLTSGQSARQR